MVPRKWNVLRAAATGAALGALLIVLNAFLQPELAAAGVAGVALAAVGGALGGAVLFVVVTWIANLLLR